MCTASLVAACNNTVYGPAGPIPPTPAACTPPACVALGPTLKAITLPTVNGVSATIYVAGTGEIRIRVSAKPQGGVPLMFALLRERSVTPVLFVELSAVNGSATLTKIPGLHLAFTHPLPKATIRLALLERNVWTTIGKPGVVHGPTVTFTARRVRPAIHLGKGDTYHMAVYAGGILPPTPSPSPSPTPSPGPLTVAVTCAESADACSNGTTSSAGSIQFTALGDTATLTPSQKPASKYTLKSDTCNTTDDPTATGNWATFTPAAGNSASSFTVKALNSGTNTNPATCSAIVTGGSGQSVTIDVEVTTGSVGIH